MRHLAHKLSGHPQQMGRLAQQLAGMGRGGDTMLAHINPQEAALLNRVTDGGSINPHTGLPEFASPFIDMGGGNAVSSGAAGLGAGAAGLGSPAGVSGMVGAGLGGTIGGFAGGLGGAVGAGLGGAMGGMGTGQAIGTGIGSALGSVFGPAGSMVGGFIGGHMGSAYDTKDAPNWTDPNEGQLQDVYDPPGTSDTGGNGTDGGNWGEGDGGAWSDSYA